MSARGQHDVHYFLASTADRSRWGHAWRLWAHGTSFYVAARDPRIGSLKFSLHGPDERPGLEPVFKLAATRRVAGRSFRPGVLPLVFPGRPVLSDVRHVLKVRFPYDAFSGSIPNGLGGERGVASGARGLIVEAPGDAAETSDVDLYVSAVGAEPFAPDSARNANALIGPIRNAAGQHLTGIARKFPVIRVPTPPAPRSLAPTESSREVTRGIWMGTAGYANAWIVETPFDRDNFDAGRAEQPWVAQPTSRECALPPPWTPGALWRDGVWVVSPERLLGRRSLRQAR